MENYHFYAHYVDKAEEGNGIFLTIMSGVTVFVVSQYILELIIKLYTEYRKIKTEISNKLKYYANVLTNPLSLDEESFKNPKINKIIENYQKASDEIRELSCILEAKYYNNHFLVRKIFIKDKTEEAGSLLIRISNNLFNISHTGINSQALLNGDDAENIKKYLNLKSRDK